MRLSHRVKRLKKHNKIIPENKILTYLKSLSDEHIDSLNADLVWKALKNKGFCEYEAEGTFWFYLHYKKDVSNLGSFIKIKSCLQECAKTQLMTCDEFAKHYFGK